MPNNNDIEKLIECEFLTRVKEYPEEIIDDNLLDLLKSKGITGFGSRKYSEALSKWCKKNIAMVSDVIEKAYYYVTISERAEKAINKFYRYLNRKYGSDLFVDEYGEQIEIPKGMIYNTTISIKENEGSFNTEIDSGYTYPDDEITRLLAKYNALR